MVLPELNAQESRLQSALYAAVERFDERVSTFSATPALRVIPSDTFYAHVFPLGEGLGIDTSTGTANQIAQAWKRALDLSAGLPPERQFELLGHPDHAADMSLRWLMQHELNHFAIGHFRITGSAGPLEAGDPKGFGIATQGAKPPELPVESFLTEDEESWLS